MPAGVLAGSTTSTDAVPASSLLLRLPGALRLVVTGKVPSTVPPRLTLTVASRVSDAAVIESDDRSNVTWLVPAWYDAGAPAGNFTPTACWANDTGSGGSPSPGFANSSM